MYVGIEPVFSEKGYLTASIVTAAVEVSKIKYEADFRPED